MQPLNWSGRIGKRVNNALPADAESVIPDIANYKKELQDRIDYLRQLNDPQSLFKAAQLEKEGLTSQIVSDLPWLSSVDKRAQSTLKQFLNNYKPTLDAPIMEVNRNTGLGFPMTQIVEENIGNKAGELERLFEQPTIYAVKGNPISRFPKLLGNHVNTRVNDFFLKNNPRLPFIKANSIYNLSKDIADKSEYEMGGQPCYECGGMYAEGGYYDCPDQEKDPVTGKCSAEVARGREAAAANKAATADMNAWAKQVAAMDKENARQNAAQTAGQLSFDYDWMQSPVDKADKKAAMAQYKQFFQQNPNVFVPDDTSGYSPEQKYIIASKLKQRLSTPMGSQLAQKKLGVDPRYYDLQRMQSELAPKMGGWNGMRDFLFNVYKEEGGEYDLPQAQWGQFVSPIDMGSIASKVMSFFGLNKQPKIVRTPASAPKRLSIRDPRKIMMTTGKPLRPNSDLVGGNYDSEDLGNLINAGKRQNLSYNDLMNIAAMGFQETKWNKEAENNIGHTQGSFGGHDQYSDLVGAYLAKMKEADRLKIKDEATRLQVYNGLGKIYPSTEKAYHGFKMKKIYGVPVPKGGIDMRKNPLYGKQVMDIRDNVLRQSPDFMRYMDSVYKAPTPEEYVNGGPIVDPMGQWAHPGRVTRIPSGNITMHGVPYPVLGVASSGQQVMMHPEQNYNFGDVEYVDEYPIMQGGGTAYVDSVLNANRNLDWVKRLYQKNGPSLQIPGQRGPSTHYMESGDGRVYPTVTMVNGKLTHLPAAGIDPFDYADSTKTYIKFPTDKEATWFGKNYKLGTGVLPEHKNGGYTVVRSNDRKGKTHKVIGPDGTVKYFGDSKLGQHPKDPKRKAAFYARHKKNLDANPYFRAFARKTWAEGGQTPDEREMVNGIADILSQVNDRQNRAQIARQMVKDFNNENVTYNYNDFMEKSSLEYGGQPNLWNMIKMAQGGEMIRRADGSYSQRGLWDNIRANKGSGKKPTKQMLQQERKIKAKNK
jgi:hypothetical protein